MVNKTIYKVVALSFLASLLIPLAAVARHPVPVYALKDPCALDPNNLVYNGSMGPQHDTQYGSLSDGWNPFIFDGTPPQFRWVGNEQIDPNGSQQVFSSSTFDAGIQQTVKNLQPGVYYWVRWGYSLAAKSFSGPNVRVDSIGRKIGVDPTGGTDPHSPNVLWGPDYFDGQAALNIPALTTVFAARSQNATIFLRAMARDGSSGENRVWIDAICMEPKADMPTATPVAATATPVPPTATVRPTQKIAVAPASPTRTATRTLTPTPPATATRVDTPTAVSTPRFARPIATPSAEGPIGLSGDLLAGVGVSSIFGSFMMFAFGLVLARRTH